MSGWKEIVDACQKNRHHTLKPFLFVCMGHACVLGQEPSLVGDGFNESVCFPHLMVRAGDRARPNIKQNKTKQKQNEKSLELQCLLHSGS